jgi:hypothetical protein
MISFAEGAIAVPRIYVEIASGMRLVWKNGAASM